MPPHSRPRSGREESPHRKPFSAAAPSPRSKFTFPAVNTPVLRRSRHNSENQPPENALNVKANSPFSDTNLSPAPPPSKSTSAKGKHHGSLSLPPRPPPPRPSPSTNSARNGHDSQGNVKRKLILEPPASAEAATTCPPSHEQQDTGVKVIIRMRPCNQKEESEEATQIVEMVSTDSLFMADQHFTFDYVAGTDSSQQTMFDMVGQPLVENCLQGFNSSIFAYGQTGSGKTYTMWGATQDLLDQPPGEERGLTPRVFECLFQRIKEEEKKNADKQLRYQCRCSFLEIYNEQITDLLEPQQKTLQVREDTKIGVYVENLTEEFVSNVEDVFRLMLRGLGNRKIASTSMNLESSRSHTLFTCVIESRCKSMSDGVSSVRTSRMNLVDLAGSERQKLTGAAGERLKEAGNINRSLSQLGNLINILAEVSQTGKPRHIPYRDSRLTFLLQESLGGNAKLAMICAISPASSCKSETLSTLRFAQRAKSIQNKAVVNEETEDDVKLLREQIRQLKDELMRIKSNETLSGAVGSYSTSWNARRSYNLLRMSLSRPMTLPHTDTDTDEEMEIDEEAVECVDAVNPSLRSDDFIREDLEFSITKKGLLNDESSRHAFDAGRHLNSSLVDADTVLVLVKSPDKHASETASYQTEFVNHGDAREEGQVGKEGLHEEVNPGVLLAKESSFQCQLQTQAEDVKIDLNDCGTVNVDLCNCLEELHATPSQETRGPVPQPQNNNLDVSTFEEPTLILQDSLDLGTECTNHETPDFLEVMHVFASTNSSDSVYQIQAENGGVSVVTESGLVLQDSLNIEPECRNDDLTSLSDDSNVGGTSSELSLVKQDVCRNSLQMEESVNTSADKNMFQEHESAPVSVNLLDFLEVFHGFASTNNSDTVSQIQAENGAVSVVTETGLVLHDSLNIEPECINDDLTSLSDDSKVVTISSELSPVKQDVCRNSLQMEESVNTSADENMFQGHESAPVSVNLLTSPNDSASVKKSVADNDKNTTLCPLEGFVEVKVHSSDPWVAADAKHDFSEGEAHIHELIIESDSIKGDAVNCTDCSDARTPESKHVLQSPILSVSPHLAMEALETPILSVSPRLQDDNKRSFGTSVPPVLFEDTSMQACQLEHADSQDAEAEMGLQGNYDGEKTQRKPLPVRSSLRSSKNLSSPTDRLAASLHRGLQILENHQKRVSNTRMSLVQFSFQNSEWDKPKPSSVVSKSVQTSPVCFPLVHVPEPVHSEAMKDNDLSNYQASERIAIEEPITPQKGSKSHLSQNAEAILAGALRRERAMEEALNRKIAEIEQLNRLVRQYKHERECNALLQQSREDKIARLESLMDGTLPTDAFLNEEWSSLINEHKILQERYDHHPEVTLGNIRQQRLCEDLEQYQSFCELGERDALLGEVSQLRNQLQYYVELDAPRSTKQRRRSLTPQAKFSAADANGEGTSPLDAPEFLDNTNVVADSGECKTCEEERVQWAERENEWMSVLEELRIEVEEYKQLAEKRKHEVEGQQRCADEMKEALQMAMEGHARLLDQYAELQEKHISLLARHRKIRDAMSEARKKAGKMGFLGGKWYEAQAAELIAVKLEQEQERKAAKEQIEGLQAQVRDIADAVQAAGELLVRLKEAEESVLIAQDAAALAEQDVDKLYRDMDKLKRRHSTEIATLQQRLLEARFQKSTVCPMCVMAERVKFEFTGVDEEEAEAAMEAQHLAAEAAKDVAASYGSLQMLRGDLPEEPYYDDNEEFHIQGMDDHCASEMDERWYEEVQKCNF